MSKNKTKPFGKPFLKDAKGKPVQAKTQGQHELVESIQNNDITFALGPAGTGKSFLSVAMAVKAIQENDIKKVILVRPAMESGEHLGFLPGDFNEKMSPYMRPLFDALEILMKPEKKPDVYVPQQNGKGGKKGKKSTPPPPPKNEMMSDNESVKYGDKVEICPLAYMRGRSLNNCFIILDEAQNATREQMKMFLTRMGEGSKIVAVGDHKQIDLPYKTDSGLKHAVDILGNTEGIAVVTLSESDIVRHPLVKKIVKAYDKYESKKDMNNDDFDRGVHSNKFSS
jgi:phosphate starvation-inducible PhoH-like protein